MVESSIFSRILAILCSISAYTTGAPTLLAIPDMYEVRDGGYAIERHFDSTGRQWKTQVNLERLEVVMNDVVYNLPFESCIEEKLTRDNKYEDYAGRKSRFDEIHKVHVQLNSS